MPPADRPHDFLSACWGAVSIGDVQVRGKIGRTAPILFLAAIYILTGMTAVYLVWSFHPETAAAKGPQRPSGRYARAAAAYGERGHRPVPR